MIDDMIDSVMMQNHMKSWNPIGIRFRDEQVSGVAWKFTEKQNEKYISNMYIITTWDDLSTNTDD